MRIIFSVFFWVLFVPCFGQKKQVAANLQSLMHKHNAVGLSVVVVKKGSIVYQNALGWKNIEAAVKLKPRHQFRIASISKSFTATGLMQLVEAGKISLDDDISSLIGFTVRNPAFPQKEITLSMLLSHTSSLNDSQGYFTLDVVNPEKRQSDSCFSNYAPGTAYRYCNLNYNMAGAILEKWSGERFDNYISNHILDALTLSGGYNIDQLDTSRFATLYVYDSLQQSFVPQEAYLSRKEELNIYINGYSTPLFSPTGGLKISAPDLARYMMMHMQYGSYKKNTILTAASARKMQTPIATEEGYGLALATTNQYITGKQMVGHTGSAYGLYSHMFFSPNEKFGLVLITNGCDGVYNDKGYLKLLHDAALVLYQHFIE